VFVCVREGRREKGEEGMNETLKQQPRCRYSTLSLAHVTIASIAQKYKLFPFLPLRLGSRILVFWEAGIGRGVGGGGGSGYGMEIWRYGVGRAGWDGMGWDGLVGLVGFVEKWWWEEEEEEEEEEEGDEEEEEGDEEEEEEEGGGGGRRRRGRKTRRETGKEQCEGVGTRAPTRSSQ